MTSLPALQGMAGRIVAETDGCGALDEVGRERLRKVCQEFHQTCAKVNREQGIENLQEKALFSNWVALVKPLLPMREMLCGVTGGCLHLGVQIGQLGVQRGQTIARNPLATQSRDVAASCQSCTCIHHSRTRVTIELLHWVPWNEASVRRRFM